MNAPSRISELIAAYEQGPAELKAAVAGMKTKELHARPVPGKWSTHEVVCHLADTEILYADRMKRVIAERNPTFFSADPDVHLAYLAVPERNVDEEVQLVELVRKQMAHILKTLRPEALLREGVHSEDGPMTLETLLSRIVGHIPNHVRHIKEKREALAREKK
jgi:hypothetical protein